MRYDLTRVCLSKYSVSYSHKHLHGSRTMVSERLMINNQLSLKSSMVYFDFPPCADVDSDV